MIFFILIGGENLVNTSFIGVDWGVKYLKKKKSKIKFLQIFA